MRVLIASEPGDPGRDNEDFAGAVPGLFVVVDGAGPPPGTETGCQHSICWYAHTLGTRLLTNAADPTAGLADALAASIEQVSALHAHTCDLGHPESPSATVAVARALGDQLEHLVLCDSIVALDRIDDRPLIVVDKRLEELRGRVAGQGHALGQSGGRTGKRTWKYAPYRNQPGGFWVASADPGAAGEALTGVTPLAEVGAVALLTDGASRLVDRFDLLTWPEVLGILHKGGPAELIARTREAERADRDGKRWPRAKIFDDASAVYWAPRREPAA